MKNNIEYDPEKFDVDAYGNLIPKETAWVYCRKCNKFDDGEHPDRPCSGTPVNFVITDGKPPCENYE